MSMSTVWQTYQSMTRDRSVAGQRVSRGTVRRILGYARPYRVIIAIFLGTLVVTSLLSREINAPVCDRVKKAID